MYHAITFLVFAAAVAAYLTGSQAGAIGLLVAGVETLCAKAIVTLSVVSGH